MHELAVTQNLLEIALRHGQAAGADRITALYLVIGDLSSIVDECVQFYWDIVSQDTIAEGAELRFRRIPAQLLCTSCGEQYSAADGALSCPSCHATQVRVVAGDEFHLEAIDIETADELSGQSTAAGESP